MNAMAEYDEERTQAAYGTMRQAQETLTGVVYACERAGFSLSWGMDQSLMQRQRRMNQLRYDNAGPGEIAGFIRGIIDRIPQAREPLTACGHVREEIRRYAVEHLESAEQSAGPAVANNWQHSRDFTPGTANYFYHHLMEGLELEQLTHPGRVEECVEIARSHTGWQEFINSGFSFRKLD